MKNQNESGSIKRNPKVESIEKKAAKAGKLHSDSESVRDGYPENLVQTFEWQKPGLKNDEIEAIVDPLDAVILDKTGKIRDDQKEILALNEKYKNEYKKITEYPALEKQFQDLIAEQMQMLNRSFQKDKESADSMNAVFKGNWKKFFTKQEVEKEISKHPEGIRYFQKNIGDLAKNIFSFGTYKTQKSKILETYGMKMLEELSHKKQADAKDARAAANAVRGKVDDAIAKISEVRAIMESPEIEEMRKIREFGDRILENKEKINEITRKRNLN